MATEETDEIEDFAPTPGLDQAFPVVLPLSHKKMGPQDIRGPTEMWTEMVHSEDRRHEWRYKRDRAQAALTREQHHAAGNRMRAEQAERDAHAVAARAHERKTEIEKSADQRLARAADSVRAMQARLQELKKIQEETECEGRTRIAEAQLLLEADRAHTREVEVLLQHEREVSLAGWGRVAEFEAKTRAQVAARGEEVERERLKSQHRVDAAKETARDRVREVEGKCDAELRAMQEQLLAVRKRCSERVDLEVSRRNATQEEAYKRRGTAAMRKEVDSLSMKQRLNDQSEDCGARVRRTEDRKDKTIAFLDEWKGREVSVLFETAAVTSYKAHAQESMSKDSLEHSVHILGRHYATHKQYNLSADDKMRGILQGALHEAPGAPSPRALPPAPSPRALPPPVPAPYPDSWGWPTKGNQLRDRHAG